ncbi:hypothetical protein ABEW05_006741 [Botrytis cinerea]
MPDMKGQFRGLRASRKSRKKVILKVFLRWLITLAIIGAIYAVLLAFSAMHVMTKATKKLFNTLITALLIMLGLAIASSLDGMIGELRWWILSQRYRSRSKVNLILEADRLQRLVVLAVNSRRHSIHAAVLCWTLLNIAAQVGLAAIGLCYSVDSSETYALVSHGNLSIADVSSIKMNKVLSFDYQSTLAQQFTANNYGLISLAFDVIRTDSLPEPGTIFHPRDPLTFCGTDYCQYVFHDTSTISAESGVNPIAVYTSRTIKSSTICSTWAVTKGGNGTENTITVATETGDFDVYIPVQGGPGQTTFMTNTLLNCGPGCSTIAAFEASALSPWFYRCNITVSPVAGATLPEHQASADLLSLASAGIALQGYATSNLANNTAFQYQMYPAESVYGFPWNGDKESMALMMSRFSTGVVAMAALYNDGIIVEGNAPMAGSSLNVTHWNYVYLIFILTAGLQLALSLAISLIAHLVVVPPDSITASMQVLRQMSAQESGVSNEHNSKEPAQHTMWIFKATPVSEDGVYDLYMEEAYFEIK